MQRLDAQTQQTHRGEQSAGRRALRGRITDLSQQSVESLAGLYCQGLQSTEISRFYIPDVAGNFQRRLNLCQGRPSRVQVPSVLPRTSARAPFGDVQRYGIACASQLIG